MTERLGAAARPGGVMVVSARYASLFTKLEARREGAFVPFFVVGDPDLETSASLLRAAVRAGADALEVGIAYSDPSADGPTLQRANSRAAMAGASAPACFELLAAFRAEFPDVPIGLLTYANLVLHGGIEAFYARTAAAGIDSVLVADVPLLEAGPFSQAARAHGVAPVMLAPPNLPRERFAKLAALCDGYTYCVARKGVTGMGTRGSTPTIRLFEDLRAVGAPPPLVGFGISTPIHVRAAIAAGAAGAITGSAVANLIEAEGADRANVVSTVEAFVRSMKKGAIGARPHLAHGT